MNEPNEPHDEWGRPLKKKETKSKKKVDAEIAKGIADVQTWKEEQELFGFEMAETLAIQRELEEI